MAVSERQLFRCRFRRTPPDKTFIQSAGETRSIRSTVAMDENRLLCRLHDFDEPVQYVRGRLTCGSHINVEMSGATCGGDIQFLLIPPVGMDTPSQIYYSSDALPCDY